MEPPAARLEVLSGKGAGMSVLVVDELLIGRNAEGAGRLADDDEISRTHARVTVDSGGRCVIEDLGSTNGTFVNGRRISEPQSLAVGDKLELGATVLLVQDLPAPPVSPMTEREVPTAQPTGTVRVEPTVINAPLPEVPPDAVGVAPTAVPEPDAPDVAPAPAKSDAPDAAPAPANASRRSVVVAPTAVPEPAQPDAPDLPPPRSLRRRRSIWRSTSKPVRCESRRAIRSRSGSCSETAAGNPRPVEAGERRRPGRGRQHGHAEVY